MAPPAGQRIPNLKRKVLRYKGKKKAYPGAREERVPRSKTTEDKGPDPDAPGEPAASREESQPGIGFGIRK